MNAGMKPLPAAVAEVTQRYRARAVALRVRGHKQEYIAARLGVSQGTLSRWLRGVGSDLRRKSA